MFYVQIVILYFISERQDKGVSSWLNFKPSRLKTDKTLAFVTTNLHLQRLKVIDGSNGKTDE